MPVIGWLQYADHQVAPIWRSVTDGIRYVSRQRNDAFCYALFDRSGVVVDATAPIPDAVLNALCLRFNVRVVV